MMILESCDAETSREVAGREELFVTRQLMPARWWERVRTREGSEDRSLNALALAENESSRVRDQTWMFESAEPDMR